MTLASGFHALRHEVAGIAADAVLGALAAFVAWGRLRAAPIGKPLMNAPGAHAEARRGCALDRRAWMRWDSFSRLVLSRRVHAVHESGAWSRLRAG